MQSSVGILASVVWVQNRRLQCCNRYVLTSDVTVGSTSGTAQCTLDHLNTATSRHVFDYVDEETRSEGQDDGFMFQTAVKARLTTNECVKAALNGREEEDGRWGGREKGAIHIRCGKRGILTTWMKTVCTPNACLGVRLAFQGVCFGAYMNN